MIREALRGAVAGAVATWVMDGVTTLMYQSQSPEATSREQAAQPNGKSAVANLVDRVEQQTGLIVPPERRPAIEQATHYLLGIGPAVLYSLGRRSLRIGGGMRRALGFGLGVFALNDEFANTQLGLAAPPEAYPMESHLRGLVGHAVYGVTVEATIQVLGG